MHPVAIIAIVVVIVGAIVAAIVVFNAKEGDDKKQQGDTTECLDGFEDVGGDCLVRECMHTRNEEGTCKGEDGGPVDETTMAGCCSGTNPNARWEAIEGANIDTSRGDEPTQSVVDTAATVPDEPTQSVVDAPSACPDGFHLVDGTCLRSSCVSTTVGEGGCGDMATMSPIPAENMGECCSLSSEPSARWNTSIEERAPFIEAMECRATGMEYDVATGECATSCPAGSMWREMKGDHGTTMSACVREECVKTSDPQGVCVVRHNGDIVGTHQHVLACCPTQLTIDSHPGPGPGPRLKRPLDTVFISQADAHQLMQTADLSHVSKKNMEAAFAAAST